LRRDWDTCWGATEIFRQCAPFATASASRRGALAALPGLNGDDFMVFGTLIQHFCFIDLNLRRALELFKLSEMLPESAKKLYPNLPGLTRQVMYSEATAVPHWHRSLRRDGRDSRSCSQGLHALFTPRGRNFTGGCSGTCFCTYLL
jgi:hypothetical protein